MITYVEFSRPNPLQPDFPPIYGLGLSKQVHTLCKLSWKKEIMYMCDCVTALSFNFPRTSSLAAGRVLLCS